MLFIPRLLIAESEQLASAGYNAQRQILDIEMKDGDVYRYLGVPAQVYLTLVQNEDKDSYFAQNIKDQFVYSKQK